VLHAMPISSSHSCKMLCFRVWKSSCEDIWSDGLREDWARLAFRNVSIGIEDCWIVGQLDCESIRKTTVWLFIMPFKAPKSYRFLNTAFSEWIQ
jgi:hypothetical protein